MPLAVDLVHLVLDGRAPLARERQQVLHRLLELLVRVRLERVGQRDGANLLVLAEDFCRESAGRLRRLGAGAP